MRQREGRPGEAVKKLQTDLSEETRAEKERYISNARMAHSTALDVNRHSFRLPSVV